MKKHAFLVLLMSALLVTGCAKPASSESKAPEQPSSNEVLPPSEEGQSSIPDESSLEVTPSSEAPAGSSMQPRSYPPSSGVKLNLTAPDNDIHTDIQYSYINDPDWRNVKAYIPQVSAEGGRNIQDLSKPKALKLAFADVADASTYYVQVSKDNTFAGADVLTTTVKEYELWNAEIGTKYYYRAAVSEDALASATVKEYQVASQAPRNLKIDGVINFRDVGGWS